MQIGEVDDSNVAGLLHDQLQLPGAYQPRRGTAIKLYGECQLEVCAVGRGAKLIRKPTARPASTPAAF